MTRTRANRITIITTLVTAIIIVASAGVFAASAPTGTAKVNSKSGAILRSSTSTSSKKVCVLNDNTKLTVKRIIFKSKTSTAAKNKWYEVTASNGKSGYIRADLVDSQKYTGASATVTGKVNYRTGAGTKMKLKGSYAKGKKVTVYLAATPVSSTKGSSKTWYMIKVGSKKYYAASSYFKLAASSDNNKSATTTGTTATTENKTTETKKTETNTAETSSSTEKVTGTAMTATGLINSNEGAYVRSSSSTSSGIVKLLEDNTSVEINKVIFKTSNSTDSTDKWYAVSVGGKSGFVRADLIDNIQYTTVSATTTDAVNYRSGAGTGMATQGTLDKGATATVCLKAEPVSSTYSGGSNTWYMIKVGSKYYYAVSTYFNVTGTLGKDGGTETVNDPDFAQSLRNQGFPETYVTKLMALHSVHPNWEFVAKNTGLDWNTAVAAQNSGTYSLIQRSGSSSWVTANKTEVAYYLDPRNFLNDDRVFMFEDLNYNSKIHTEAVVTKVLAGTYLETYGFKASWFVKYGAMYDVSPVHLASRAKQETGGGSAAINGHGEIKNTVVYNPFNIGAYSTVYEGLQKAYDKGWTTKEKAIKGGAEFIASGYINAGQNTMYSQKFNFVNKKASHQYMQNIKAPYSESYSTYNSYSKCGILGNGFKFIIPVYTGMPSKTSL